MLHRAFFVLLLSSACTFSAQLDEEAGPDAGGEQPSNPQPPVDARCNQPGMKLCVNFENSTADGLNATIEAKNIGFMPRPVGTVQEQAGRFLAASSYKVLDNARLDIPTAMTISMWIKPGQLVPSGGDEQFGLFDAHGQYRINFERDRDIECELDGDDTLDSAMHIGAIAAWQHVACTYDGTTLKVWHNGRLAGCRETQRPISTTSTLGGAIGANVADTGSLKNGFVGELDNVHLFARALSAQEICAAWGYGGCDADCPSGPQQGNDGE